MKYNVRHESNILDPTYEIYLKAELNRSIFNFFFLKKPQQCVTPLRLLAGCSTEERPQCL